MMDINRNNYEAWLLDLLEGRLSPEEAQEVREFISLNPDYASELETFEPVTLNAENFSFSGKGALRKEIPDHNSSLTEKDFDLFSIARLEGDLSESQQKEFQDFLERDEQKLEEWLLWEQIKLTETSILYHRKDSLKKRIFRPSRVIWISVAAAAAAVGLFFTLFRPDPAVNPVAPLAVETDITEPLPGREAQETRENKVIEAPPLENRIVEIAREEPVMEEEAAKPAENLIAEVSPAATQENREPKEAVLEEKPLKMAMLDKRLIRPAGKVSYDKIENVDLSLQPAYADRAGGGTYSEGGLKETYRTFLEEKDISLLSVASAGVEGINRLSGSDLKLNVARDEKGEVKGFRFRSALLSVDSPVKKQKKSR